MENLLTTARSSVSLGNRKPKALKPRAATISRRGSVESAIMAGKREVPRYLRDDPVWREVERKRKAGIPRDAIEADPSQQAPNNSYSSKTYYQDYEFNCVDCGIPQVWTAEQQQWWYEVAKGPIFSVAVRCRACRKASRAAANGEQQGPSTQGPKPIITIRDFLARVRASLDPILHDAGYSFSARSDSRCDRDLFNAWEEYCRGPNMMSLSFNSRERTLSLTAMDEKAGVEEIVSLCIVGGSRAESPEFFIKQFIDCVKQSPFFSVDFSPPSTETQGR